MNEIMPHCLGSIFEENRQLLQRLDWTAVADFVDCLRKAPLLLFAAQGRSGYVLRTFCMRLMHLGFKSHFVGETLTPPISKADLFIALSGSGETVTTCEMARIAGGIGATTYAIVANDHSRLADVVHRTIVLPGGAKTSGENEIDSCQPPGSLFEQSAFLLLETIALAFYREQGCAAESLLARHANLE